MSIAAAVLLHATSSILNRYGRQGEFHIPQALKVRMLPLRPSADASRKTPPGSLGMTAILQLLTRRYYAIRYYVRRNNAPRNNMSDPNLLVLSSLAGGDKHGYAMMEDIERFAGVRLGPGTLYGAITRLEQRGWIRPVASDDRRQPYTLTAAGTDLSGRAARQLEKVVKTGLTRLRHA